MFMIGFSRFRFNTWKKKDFSFLQKSTVFISRFYLVCEKIVLIGIGAVSAGVKGFECDITGGLNENTPICRRGIFESVRSRYTGLVGIPIVTPYRKKLNLFVGTYV